MCTAEDYRLLADLKHHIRRFGQVIELAVRGLNLEPRQHQLALALQGLARGKRPPIADLPERLPTRHHRTVEVVNRLATRGYLRRQQGGENDRREVFLTLISQGEESAGQALAVLPGRTA